MCHILVFGYWRAAWWRNLAFQWTELSPELAEGLAAYAAEQAVCEEACASGWAAKWAPVHKRTLLEQHQNQQAQWHTQQ